MLNLENLDVFEISITQKTAKMPKGPFCQIGAHIILVFIAIMLMSKIYFPKTSLFSCLFAYNTVSDLNDCLYSTIFIYLFIYLFFVLRNVSPINIR